jgi:hypothetical protein
LGIILDDCKESKNKPEMFLCLMVGNHDKTSESGYIHGEAHISQQMTITGWQHVNVFWL